MTVRSVVEQMNPSGIDANESITHRSSGPLRQISARRYGLAILSVGVALGASLLLDHFHFRVPSALLLLFAVAISSWYAGAGPAVLAAILSTISFYWYFVEPVRTIYINRSEIPNFVIFAAFAALLSRFGTFRQRAEADLRPTQDQLKIERPKLGSRIIALLYFAFSSCWILFTDRLVHRLGLSDTQLLKVSEAKGILFISLSTLLMYVLVEKALRQRHSLEAAYWQLVETAQEGVWSVDAEGKTVFANENMAAILGTSRGEMIGKSILPFVPQEKKDELLNRLLRRERGLQEHYEFAFLRADGAQVWTLLRVSPVFRHGQHTGSLALVSDITERKRAEEALRRLNRELRAISNCNQVLLRATDEQSLLQEICRIVCEEAGYRMAWVSYAEHDEAKSARPVAWSGAEEGYLASAGITWADTDRGRSLTGTTIRSGKTCYIQDFATDPRFAPWRDRALQHGFRSGIGLPLKDEQANVFGSLTIHSAQPNAFAPEEIRLLEELAADLAFGVVTLRSQAARKQAEEALWESETRFRTFVDHAADALFIYDFEQGTIVDVNRQACESLGYTRQELIGTTPLAFDRDVDRAATESIAEWTAAGEAVIDTHWHRRQDGTLFPVEVHTSQYGYGGRRFLLKVARDISDRLRAEEERERLRQLEAELAHVNRVSMMGELAVSIAHEVNQPLSGIVSNGSACLRFLARDTPNVEEAREAARDIVRDGKRAGEVIARIRALTKRAATPRETLDLNETIRDVLALAGDEAKKRNVIIRTQLADDLSPVSGDRVQLQQVGLNLIMNGMEAMSGVEQRRRELVITTRRIEPDQVQVTVADSGIGLDPNTMGRIFDPFYSTKAGGMGMGLSISRSIVQAHGGRLWATVNDGPGTSFHFTLPKYHAGAADAGVAGV